MDRQVAKYAGAGLIIAICFLIAALEGYDIQAFGVAAPRLAPPSAANTLAMRSCRSALRPVLRMPRRSSTSVSSFMRSARM